ncbi:MAG: dephospho-CoA kinase [Candidatus Omnitrophica bacterium]|nr:dephospho-CoA kinase [Candidatus Omnitrophota bacterium]
MKKRLIVGVTGSFGSGKSTTCKILRRLGARKVIHSDPLTREVFKPRHPIGKRIQSLFHIQGRINRKRVAKRIFSDPKKRRQLEALIHPYVFQRIRSELNRVKRGVVVIEVPLLFETGFDRLCDVTIAIFAPEKVVIKRLKERGFQAREVRARLRAQLPASEKRKRSDLYISNSGSKQVLVQKTKHIWNQLKLQLRQSTR